MCYWNFFLPTGVENVESEGTVYQQEDLDETASWRIIAPEGEVSIIVRDNIF